MEYQVPQFIEVEDKIFGPLTLKQFIYLAGGAGACAVALLYLPLVLGVLVAVPIAALSGALAFYRINRKPFIEMLGASVSYLIGSKLYLWKHQEHVAEAPQMASVIRKADAPHKAAPLTRGKLRDLAWSLDVNDTAAKG